MAEVISRLWQLQPFGSQPDFQYCALTPEAIEQAVVIAAWAHALRHTAKGLDLPDHEAALELLLERHPSWQVIAGRPVTVQVNLGYADQDVPETG